MGLMSILSKYDLRELSFRLEQATRKADVASQQWEERRDYLTDYCAINGYTEEQRRSKFKIDWKLNDAMDAWNWHRREANRIAQLILAEKALREMPNA